MTCFDHFIALLPRGSLYAGDASGRWMTSNLTMFDVLHATVAACAPGEETTGPNALDAWLGTDGPQSMGLEGV